MLFLGLARHTSYDTVGGRGQRLSWPAPTIHNAGSRTRPARGGLLGAVAVAVTVAGACAAPNPARSDTTAAKPHKPAPASTTAPAPKPLSYVTPGHRMGVGSCPLFPDDNAFHATVTALSVRADSAAVVASMGGKQLAVRSAFSSGIWEGSRAGLPVNLVDSRTAKSVDFAVGTYAYLSDHSGHPLPNDPRFEGWPTIAWDRHLLVVDTATCTSSEFFFVTPPWMDPLGRWKAETAVKINLRSNSPRARGSATASGTSMLAGLIRYDEVASGRIDHVIGIAVPKVKAASPVWPATGTDGRSTDANAPAMGSWLRLRTDVDLSKLGPQASVVARALQEHGAVVSDTNGSGMALGGDPDERWDDRDLATLSSLSAADFDVVDPTPMKVSDGSSRIR